MFAAILLGLIALAFMFWLVEWVRAKVAKRPPSWKRDYEPVPPNSPGRAMWAPMKLPSKKPNEDETDA